MPVTVRTGRHGAAGVRYAEMGGESVSGDKQLCGKSGRKKESMEKSQWYMGAPNAVVLCADRWADTRLEGGFYHVYKKEPVLFSSVDEAIFALEQFYDGLKFPYSATGSRTFDGMRSHEYPAEERVKIMKDEEVLSRHGDLGTFIIRVQHRQNSSWQGRITWMEKNKTVYFRSIWEMIKLVAGELDTISAQESDSRDG